MSEPETRAKCDAVLYGRYGYTYLAKHTFRSWPKFSDVYIGHEKTTDDEVWLSPRQALELLDWLKQEEQELQRLAKEQEG